MAEIAKPADGIVSVSTTTPSPNSRLGGMVAGENLISGDIVYIRNADGLVMKGTGAAANDAANTIGFVPHKANSGEAVSVYRDMRVNYPSTGLRGRRVYLSGTVAGGLADVASIGGTVVIGYVVDDKRIHLFP